MGLNQASPRLVTAETSVRLADPVSIIEAFQTHYGTELDVTREGGSFHFRGDFGHGVMTAEGGKLSVRLDCIDENTLVAVKSSVAEHLMEFAGNRELDFTWQGVGAGQHIIRNLYQMSVVRAFNVTPRMRRLVLACDNIEKLMHGGLHIRLLIPPKGRAPVWPTVAQNGSFSWPGGEDALSVRVYTIRRGDVARGEIEVDFVMHEGDQMPGAHFGATAQPGDIVGVIGPGGGVVPGCRRYVLAGDETALPVMSRIVEEMPAGVRVEVFAEIADAAEEQEIVSQADVEWRWLYRNGQAPGTAGLLEKALSGHDFGDDREGLHVFAGCEKDEARAIKALLQNRFGLPKSAFRVAGYWMIGDDHDDHDH